MDHADTQGLAAALWSLLGIYKVTDLIEMARSMARSSVLHEMIVTAVEQDYLEQRVKRPWCCRLWWPNAEPPNGRKQRKAQ